MKERDEEVREKRSTVNCLRSSDVELGNRKSKKMNGGINKVNLVGEKYVMMLKGSE